MAMLKNKCFAVTSFRDRRQSDATRTVTQALRS